MQTKEKQTTNPANNSQGKPSNQPNQQQPRATNKNSGQPTKNPPVGLSGLLRHSPLLPHTRGTEDLERKNYK